MHAPMVITRTNEEIWRQSKAASFGHQLVPLTSSTTVAFPRFTHRNYLWHDHAQLAWLLHCSVFYRRGNCRCSLSNKLSKAADGGEALSGSNRFAMIVKHEGRRRLDLGQGVGN
eukprot:TRINITY_DN23243_c0_g1_i2.p1 TRINITY_DN23243_c0_g1~~TRINITY_DN23243_c0_g1_i2.p1  ORF type:complete len:114 (+),score=17.07 TRINITY_DN23243_c0_g1_i2:391-732(+)